MGVKQALLLMIPQEMTYQSAEKLKFMAALGRGTTSVVRHQKSLSECRAPVGRAYTGAVFKLKKEIPASTSAHERRITTCNTR